MNPLLTTTLRPIVLASLLETLPQKPGTSIAALIVFFLFIFFTNNEPEHPEMPSQYSRERREQIENVSSRIKAVAIVTHAYSDVGLTPKYSSNLEVTPSEILSIYHDSILDTLRLGDCVRIDFEGGGIATDDRGYSLPGIICPIVQNGRLIGTISGVYRKLPPPAPDGSDNPISRELFFLGTEIYQ